MKKTLIIILIFIIVGSLTSFTYIYTSKININHKMKTYLKDKGYKDSEVKSTEVRHSFMNVVLSYNEWTISVIYNDEPNASYYYFYDKGSISQGGISGRTKNDVYKHVEPEPLYR